MGCSESLAPIYARRFLEGRARTLAIFRPRPAVVMATLAFSRAGTRDSVFTKRPLLEIRACKGRAPQLWRLFFWGDFRSRVVPLVTMQAEGQVAVALRRMPPCSNSIARIAWLPFAIRRSRTLQRAGRRRDVSGALADLRSSPQQHEQRLGHQTIGSRHAGIICNDVKW